MIQKRCGQEGRALANMGVGEGWKEGLRWKLIGKNECERCLVDTACSGTLVSGRKKNEECTGGQSVQKVDTQEHGVIHPSSLTNSGISIRTVNCLIQSISKFIFKYNGLRIICSHNL